MKSRAACRPAKARCWWWTLPRAWRRRPSPIPTWRCTTTWKSSRSSIRSTCRRRSPNASASRSKPSSDWTPATPFWPAPSRAPGVHEILEAIVHLVPPPKGSPDAPLRALIFDSWFDPYRGVIILVRVMDGRLRKGQKIRLWSNGQVFEVEKASATRRPRPRPATSLSAGEVGFLFATIKTVSDAQDRRHHSVDATRTPRRSPCPVSRKSSPWCSPGSTRWSPTSTGCCATPWKNCASTTAPSISSPKIRWPWASASAAASWACCTWRSCRSGWSASSISTSSPPPPPCATASPPRPGK